MSRGFVCLASNRFVNGDVPVNLNRKIYNKNVKQIIVTSELVVDVQPKVVSIALLEDKSSVELQKRRKKHFSVGNMYLGRVKKLMPGLNACFVDVVGYEKDAFLSLSDLGPQFNSLEKYVKQTLSDKKSLIQLPKQPYFPTLKRTEQYPTHSR